MSYATPTDMTAAFPNRDLVQLTNEDPSVTTVDSNFIQTYLDKASSLIDSYIEARFTLPFATDEAPAVLKDLCLDIAMYKMQALRPLHDLEDARKRYEDAIKTLEKVNQGKITLGLSAQSEEPAIAQNVETIAGPERKFSRDKMRGW